MYLSMIVTLNQRIGPLKIICQMLWCQQFVVARMEICSVFSDRISREYLLHILILWFFKHCWPWMLWSNRISSLSYSHQERVKTPLNTTGQIQNKQWIILNWLSRFESTYSSVYMTLDIPRILDVTAHRRIWKVAI